MSVCIYLHFEGSLRLHPQDQAVHEEKRMGEWGGVDGMGYNHLATYRHIPEDMNLRVLIRIEHKIKNTSYC